MEKYEIEISQKANEDILSCVEFAKNISLDAAYELANDIFSFIDSLKTLPERNPLFEIPGYSKREIRKGIVMKRYLIFYEIDKKIIVHRVLDFRKGLDQLIF